jgi:fluoride exporter
MTALLVFFGAGLGGLTRFGLGTLVQQAAGPGFPWGTLVVNVTGSLLLGFLYMVLEGTSSATLWRAFLGIGFCGGYTTFSAFSYDTVLMMQAGHGSRALAYALGTVLLCLIATLVGFRFATMLRTA